jgi:hypothetical protein
MWVWLHAAFYDDALLLLEAQASGRGVTVNKLRDELVRFELRGERSQEVLFTLLADTPAAPSAGHEQMGALKALKVRSAAALPAHTVLGVSLVDTRKRRGRQPFAAYREKGARTKRYDRRVGPPDRKPTDAGSAGAQPATERKSCPPGDALPQAGRFLSVAVARRGGLSDARLRRL